MQKISARKFHNGASENEIRWVRRTKAGVSAISTEIEFRRSPAAGTTPPLNSQDIGTSRWQLEEESTSALSPDN
jgi:hypothetical protein